MSFIKLVLYTKQQCYQQSGSVKEQSVEKYRRVVRRKLMIRLMQVLLKNLKAPLVDVHNKLGLAKPQHYVFYARI